MSSSSEDDDDDNDGQMQKLLEATDATLLTDSMFATQLHQPKSEGPDLGNVDNAAIKSHSSDIQEKSRSQRHLDEEIDVGADLNLPEAVRRHLAKKFTQIITQKYEFIDLEPKRSSESGAKSRSRNKVKLLRDAECYVKPYEEFEYDTKGPDKKPLIKRRQVDVSQPGSPVNLETVAVDGDYILSGRELKYWVVKKERKDKVFHYKKGSGGLLHAKEDINEFSALRRKNRWNESKIKDYGKR